MKYKHLHRFKDRHGNHRIYYRKPGWSSISLPADMDSPEFAIEYRRAEKLQSGDAPEALVSRQADWSGRRLKKSVQETMADSGVYLLIRRGKVVYVGSSQDCAARIAKHRQNGRAFDKAYYIFAERSEMVSLEGILIAAIRPPQNKAVPAFRKLGSGTSEVCESQPEEADIAR